MKKLLFLLLIVCASTSQADFVYRIGNTFLTTADMDGDGRADPVLVDGSNCTVRIGYQQALTNISWAAPRSLGLAELSDIACGTLRTNANDVLTVCSPSLNHFVFYNLASATQSPVPESGYGTGIGPESIVALEIAGGGNEDLLAVSSMNGTTPYHMERLGSTGTSLASLGYSTSSTAWQYLNEIEYLAGSNGVALIDSASGGVLRIYDPSSSGFNYIGSKVVSSLTNATYVSFLSGKTGYAEFVAWGEGTSSIQTFAWTGSAFSSTATYDLGSRITSIQVVQNDGVQQLAVVFKDGDSAALYNYNGSEAPSWVQNFSFPSSDQVVGFLSIGSDDLVMISSPSGDLSGELTADQMTADSGGFISVGTQTLPSFGKSLQTANVMTFENEPFVDNTPRRLQVLRAGDWVSGAKLTTEIQATFETDRGISQGLGDTDGADLGALHVDAGYALYSQIHDAISMHSFDAARGDDVVTVMVSPDPGLYGTSINVSFSTDPAAPVYYRTAPTNNWTPYVGSFPLFSDADVEFYARPATQQSIIRTAEYRFSETPSELDSDGDGIPDYVELANGLDPEESGLDSDGDGYSDLDELLEGSDPTTTNSIPANSNRVEKSVVYDQKVYARPYDGVANEYAYAYFGTQYWLYSPGGAQHGYTKIQNGYYSSTFEGVPLSMQPPFVSIITEPRYDLREITERGTNNQLGVELIGVVLQPTSGVTEVSYDYQYGELAVEASNWVTAARTVYTNQTRIEQVTILDENDVVAALLIERKLADLLLDRGVISNGWKSMFKGRTADQDMEGLSGSDIQTLETEGAGGEPAYHIRTLIEEISSASQSNLRLLAKDLYDICSDLGRSTNNIGKYMLPVDVLRQFIYDGTLQSNYLAVTTRTSEQLSSAYTEATQALAQVSTRTTGLFTLTVRTNSFDAAYPVLYTAGGTAKSLYTSTGNAYKFPVTFTLQSGAALSVEAFTDVTWSDCPGTDPLEVISVSLTAVPTASGADADGNLIPDDYENLFLVGGGNSPTNDLDDDGFSNLQEYLDGTDPNDINSYGAGGPVDLSPPIVTLQLSAGTDGELTIDWPAAYADDFIFTIQYTDALGVPFAEEQQLPRGDLSGTITRDQSDSRFYRVIMRTR